MMGLELKSLSDMILFVEVVRAGGFRTAALRLQIPVATLSRRLNMMERRLGVKLLLRTTRSMSIAESAKPFFDQCVEVLESAKRAHALLSSAHKQASRLRLSMPVDLGVGVLAPAIALFAESRPWLSIDFDLTSNVRDLYRDPVDIAFRIGKPIDTKVVARKVGSIAAGLYASSAFLSSCTAIQDAKDLTRVNCLNLTGAQGSMPWHIGQEKWSQAPGSVRFSANSVALARVLAEQGQGVALLPCHLAQASVYAGKLIPILPDEPVPSWPVFAVTASRSISADARALITFVKDGLTAAFDSDVTAAQAQRP